jgi:hypothetical protein
LPLFIPVVLVGGSALLSGTGGKKGADGADKISKTRRMVDEAHVPYEAAFAAARAQHDLALDALRRYAQLKHEIYDVDLRAFVEAWKALGASELTALSKDSELGELVKALQLEPIAGPAIAVTGLMINARGSKARDEARQQVAKLTSATAEANAAHATYSYLDELAGDYATVAKHGRKLFAPQLAAVQDIAERGTSLDDLDGEDRDVVMQAANTAKALKAVLDTPLVDAENRQPDPQAGERLCELRDRLGISAMDHPRDTHRDQANAERIRSATIGLVADGAAHHGAERLATATEQVIQDAVHLENLIKRKARVDLALRQGTAFECLEALKFNRDAARAGNPLRAKLTCFDDYHAPADIEIWHRTELVRRIQCKSRLRPAQTLRDLANPKYHGMGRLAPADQAESITNLLDHRVRQDNGNIYGPDYRDVDEHFMDELAHDKIASGGTTRAEAERAADAPGTAALRFSVEESMREVSDAARKGLIAGAVVGGTLSGADNLRAWRRGNVSGPGALIATSKAAASAGGRGAIVAAGARVITIAARRAGHIRFASGSGPAAVATAAIDLGGVLDRYVRGNISPDELRHESVNIFAGAALSTYCGIAGQALIPVPVAGALIGSLVGTAVSRLVLEGARSGLARAIAPAVPGSPKSKPPASSPRQDSIATAAT